MNNAEVVVADWQEFSDNVFEQFEEALKRLGIHMYNLDTSSDTYVIALSPKELNTKQLVELGQEFGIGVEE